MRWQYPGLVEPLSKNPESVTIDRWEPKLDQQPRSKPMLSAAIMAGAIFFPILPTYGPPAWSVPPITNYPDYINAPKVPTREGYFVEPIGLPNFYHLPSLVGYPDRIDFKLQTHEGLLVEPILKNYNQTPPISIYPDRIYPKSTPIAEGLIVEPLAIANYQSLKPIVVYPDHVDTKRPLVQEGYNAFIKLPPAVIAPIYPDKWLPDYPDKVDVKRPLVNEGLVSIDANFSHLPTLYGDKWAAQYPDSVPRKAAPIGEGTSVFGRELTGVDKYQPTYSDYTGLPKRVIPQDSIIQLNLPNTNFGILNVPLPQWLPSYPDSVPRARATQVESFVVDANQLTKKLANFVQWLANYPDTIDRRKYIQDGMQPWTPYNIPKLAASPDRWLPIYPDTIAKARTNNQLDTVVNEPYPSHTPLQPDPGNVEWLAQYPDQVVRPKRCNPEQAGQDYCYPLPNVTNTPIVVQSVVSSIITQLSGGSYKGLISYTPIIPGNHIIVSIICSSVAGNVTVMANNGAPFVQDSVITNIGIFEDIYYFEYPNSAPFSEIIVNTPGGALNPVWIGVFEIPGTFGFNGPNAIDSVGGSAITTLWQTGSLTVPNNQTNLLLGFEVQGSATHSPAPGLGYTTAISTKLISLNFSGGFFYALATLGGTYTPNGSIGASVRYYAGAISYSITYPYSNWNEVIHPDKFQAVYPDQVLPAKRSFYPEVGASPDINFSSFLPSPDRWGPTFPDSVSGKKITVIDGQYTVDPHQFTNVEIPNLGKWMPTYTDAVIRTRPVTVSETVYPLQAIGVPKDSWNPTYPDWINRAAHREFIPTQAVYTERAILPTVDKWLPKFPDYVWKKAYPPQYFNQLENLFPIYALPNITFATEAGVDLAYWRSYSQDLNVRSTQPAYVVPQGEAITTENTIDLSYWRSYLAKQ